MNLKEIRELLDALTEKDIAEFEFERGNEKIRVRRATTSNGAPQIAFTSVTPALPVTAVSPALPSPLPAAPSAGPAAPATAREVQEELHIIKSPIVGTFYESPSPGAPVFVQVGDSVQVGQVLCIIEAMKLMNEIESDAAGVIERRFVTNQQPVEYGEALYGIRKSR